MTLTIPPSTTWKSDNKTLVEPYYTRSQPTLIQAGSTNGQLMQASAVQLPGGYTVSQDYQEEILDYRNKLTVLWQEIDKDFATQNIIQHPEKNRRPKFGAADKYDLSNNVGANTKENTRIDLKSHTPQEIQATWGECSWTHYQRSLQAAQGNSWEDAIYDDTHELFEQGHWVLEQLLFSGDNSRNPYEFNGIETQMDHFSNTFDYYVDLTSDPPESIADKINEICTLSTNRHIVRRVTDIWCTSEAYVLLNEEAKENSLKYNQLEIIPNVLVRQVLTGDQIRNGIKPVRPSVFLNNVKDWTDPDDGKVYDLVRIYLLDMKCVKWWTLPQVDGARSHELQLKNLYNYNQHQPLLEQRAVLLYGTPMLYNQSCWRINIKVPTGRFPNLTVKEPLY